jgi:hypothetical protein
VTPGVFAMLINLDASAIVVFDDRMVFDDRKSITPRFQFSYQQSEEGGLVCD